MFSSKESLFIFLQNCQKCQNNKETLFAGRTLFTWLITSISAFLRLFMNLWYCTPFFYNSSTHRMRCQSLQHTGSEVSVDCPHVQKTHEGMSDMDGCISHRNALCFIWLFDFCTLLDVWKSGNEKQRICDEDPESDQHLWLVWCIYSLATWTHDDWVCVGSVITSEHIQTHPEASLTLHRNLLILRHHQHKLRPDSAPDPDPALNIALTCSNSVCLELLLLLLMTLNLNVSGLFVSYFYLTC